MCRNGLAGRRQTGGMPAVEHDGRHLQYEAAGASDGAVVAFVNDVGYGPWLWGWQAPALTGPRRTVVWDLPGAGESDPPADDCDVAGLADALETVLGAVDARRAHLVGAGLGGMVALAYARRHGRARSLTFLGAATSGDSVDAAALDGLRMDPADPATCEPSLAGALTPAFRSARPDLVEQVCEWRRAEDAHGDAFEAQAAAMLGFEGVTLPAVTLPALVCHGEDDPVVPPSAGRTLAEALPRGEFEAVRGRHCCYLEHSRAVTDRLAAFLERVEAA